MTTERWQEVPGLDGRYMVSDAGRMARIIGRPVLDRYGMVRVMVRGAWKTLGLHRIIAEAFVGVIPEGHVVHHKNQDFQDNRAENLEILSREAHASLPHSRYQLTAEDFDYIKSCRRPGRGRRKASDKQPTLQALSKQYGIPFWVLHSIQLGRLTYESYLHFEEVSS